MPVLARVPLDRPADRTRDPRQRVHPFKTAAGRVVDRGLEAPPASASIALSRHSKRSAT